MLDADDLDLAAKLARGCPILERRRLGGGVRSPRHVADTDPGTGVGTRVSAGPAPSRPAHYPAAVRHKRFGIDGLVVDGQDVSLRYCDLLVAVQEGSADVDWECLASTNDEVRLAQGAYPLVLRSTGRSFDGKAIVVRSDGVPRLPRGRAPRRRDRRRVGLAVGRRPGR